MAIPEDIRSILLLQSGALGDTVLQLRIAQGLKRAWPGASVAWVGRDGWLALARRCRFADRALGADGLRLHRLFEAGDAMPQDLRELLGSFDLLVNGMAAGDSPLAARLREVKPEAVISYDTRPRARVSRHVCRQWMEQIASGLPTHAAEHALAALEAPDALLRAEAGDVEAARGLLERGGTVRDEAARGIVLLHPGSGGRQKCWPFENYLALRRLLVERGWQAVMVLGPAEVERLGERVTSLAHGGGVIVDPPLEAMLGLGHLAAGYVGNDAGPTHLLAAANVPTVAIFGPTEPAVWGPMGRAVHVVRSTDFASGWLDLPADRVAQALAAVLPDAPGSQP